MGWTGERASRDEVVNRQAGPWKSLEGWIVRATKQHRSGDEDWFLYEVRDQDGSLREKFIQVTVWESGMHKEMSEACAPYFFGCPVEWFDEVRQPKLFSDFNWREQVLSRNRAA